MSPKRIIKAKEEKNNGGYQTSLFDDDYGQERYPTAFLPPDPKAPHLKQIQIRSLTNLDLALLYQSKRCLFVEGESDGKHLKMFADRLQINCFQGPDQVVVTRAKVKLLDIILFNPDNLRLSAAD